MTSLHLALGRVVASITLAQLSRTFSITADSPDGQMLRQVESGLRFIGEIRPGDSIPDELLDGTATWCVERRHYDLVRSRLLVRLVRWTTEGNSAVDANVDTLILVETAEIKGKINEAFAVAARHLGVEDAETPAVPAMIAQLASLLAQIEALREKGAAYVAILKKLKELASAYRNDTRLSDTIGRVTALMTRPFATLRRQFQLADIQTTDIIESLVHLSGTMHALREIRDQLREFVLLWGDLDDAWRDLPIERGPIADALINRTYRFAATHYLITQSWAANPS